MNLQILNYNSISSLKQIHARIITHSVFLSSSMHNAQLFDTMPQRDSSVFNTLIRAYTREGLCKEALNIYKHMHCLNLYPDLYTFPFVVRVCGVMLKLQEGRMVHCNGFKYGFSRNHFVQNALITMYSQSGQVSDSESVFREIKLKNIFAWTAMISCFSQNCLYGKALSVFYQMLCFGTLPNEITLVSLLPCLQGVECLNLGKMIHGFSTKFGLGLFQTLLNALLAMYGKCGDIKHARYMFDEMPVKNLVSWNTMIAMYEQNNEPKKAVELFRKMLREKLGFNCVTLVSVLSACASLGSFEIGKWVHDLSKNKNLHSDFRVGNVLIDMYAKCGRLDHAQRVFDEMPQKSLISYTTIINALANHGKPKQALNLFWQMKKQGIKPNSFTFTAILSACVHSGLINEGLNHFEDMRKVHSISPTLEHYTCIVDLLGRDGNILEAYKFIKNMDTKPDMRIWGALLGACRIHGRLDIAEFVARDIFELGYDINDVNYYMLLMNIYGDNERWQDVERLRNVMKDMELKKTPGRSFVATESKLCSRKF